MLLSDLRGKSMNIQIFVIATIPILASGFANAEERTANITVAGLQFSSCPYVPAEVMESIKSVRITGGHYDSKNHIAYYEVRFDDTVTTAKTITNSVSDQGYPSGVIEIYSSGS
jgi:hypothetical protein